MRRTRKWRTLAIFPWQIASPVIGFLAETDLVERDRVLNWVLKNDSGERLNQQKTQCCRFSWTVFHWKMANHNSFPANLTWSGDSVKSVRRTTMFWCFVLLWLVFSALRTVNGLAMLTIMFFSFTVTWTTKTGVCPTTILAVRPTLAFRLGKNITASSHPPLSLPSFPFCSCCSSFFFTKQ